LRPTTKEPARKPALPIKLHRFLWKYGKCP
jgi:hypothetical protein